jgi:acetylornithine deacetylase/succinyl-diaminopimelate desuccinylase-like protein
MNFAKLGDEAIDLLRRYLTIDTTNPPGDEVKGARFLADVLSADGVKSEIVESAPGRANIRARLAGDGSLGAMVLHHHIDVVYADRRYWTVDPFGGEIKDGYLYGRGALDMKSTGIMQLAAMLAIARQGVRLKRDLVLLGTADEEAGSQFGARFIASSRPEWLAGAEYALGELGSIHEDRTWRAPLGMIDISEKIGLPLRLTARSSPGHGSMPWPTTAPHRLVNGLARLLAAEREPRVLPAVRQFFAQLGSVLPGNDGGGFDDIEKSLRDPVFRERFLADRWYSAMVRTTFAVNMLKGSEKRNVIPPEAVADIDCRLLAGDDPDEIIAWVKAAVADENITVETTTPPKRPNMSPADTELYKSMAAALKRRIPNVVVAPRIMTGFTDNWTFRGAGMKAYGFSPIVLTAEESGRVHGNDERISLENVREGTRLYTEMLLEMAAR